MSIVKVWLLSTLAVEDLSLLILWRRDAPILTCRILRSRPVARPANPCLYLGFAVDNAGALTDTKLDVARAISLQAPALQRTARKTQQISRLVRGQEHQRWIALRHFAESPPLAIRTVVDDRIAQVRAPSSG